MGDGLHKALLNWLCELYCDSCAKMRRAYHLLKTSRGMGILCTLY